MLEVLQAVYIYILRADATGYIAGRVEVRVQTTRT